VPVADDGRVVREPRGDARTGLRALLLLDREAPPERDDRAHCSLVLRSESGSVWSIPARKESAS
jgi:hypothetical protein